MTERQREVFAAIRNWITEHGHPPTRRELARTLDINVRTTQKHLEALQRGKWIKLLKGQCRGIVLLKESLERTQLLLFGEISAGSPREAIEQYDIADFQDLFDHYAMALEVADDSLENDQQLKAGDYRIWKPGKVLGMIRLI